ncbi:MAG: DNA-binding response regulator [Nitrospirae bacterium]|nr:MAG: DNA-binding response regulator [Nitrospirota bacterium]
MAITVFIADDHLPLRRELQQLFETQPDLLVVGEASNGTEAIRKVKNLSPQVILLDISMPGKSVIETLAELRRVSPATKILILTMYEEEQYVKTLLEKGASGYVCKQVADIELITAIHAVHKGRLFVDVHLPELAQSDTPRLLPPLVPQVLSVREQEIFRLVVRGHTNLEIAQTIQISVKSVETYRARVMKKLGLRTRAELVRYAIETELL